jgi:hypothetical protein
LRSREPEPDVCGPQKDLNDEHPVATAWRPTFEAVVSAFVLGDFELSAGVRGVRPISLPDAESIRQSISDYGPVTLVELPEEAWLSSVAQWMGYRWEVLVDLWTAEEGRSDLVLDAYVYEIDEAFQFELNAVYVP